MTLIFGRKAAAALLLVLNTAAAVAQTLPTNPLLNDPLATPRDRTVGSKIPPISPAQDASPAAVAEPQSVAADAIRVPAMGTAAQAEASVKLADKPAIKTVEKIPPRKRPRVIVRHVEFADLPPPHYAPMPYHRFGYGYGPGIRLYRW